MENCYKSCYKTSYRTSGSLLHPCPLLSCMSLSIEVPPCLHTTLLQPRLGISQEALTPWGPGRAMPILQKNGQVLEKSFPKRQFCLETNIESMSVLMGHLTLPKGAWSGKINHPPPLGLLPAPSVSNCCIGETPPAMENWVRLQLSPCWWASGKFRGAGSRAEQQPSTAPSGHRAGLQRLGLAPGLNKARMGFVFGRGWRGCCAMASWPAAETMSGPRHWLEVIPDRAGWGKEGESEWWINPFWVTCFMKSRLLSAPALSYANRHCWDGAWVRFIYLESL